MTTAASSDSAPQDYPGQRFGLPATGRGSLSPWRSRFAALVVDWAICMGVAVLLFGTGVLTENGWRSWTILATFFLESALLTALVGGSVGQLVCRIAVVRLDRRPVPLPYALVRSAMVCLVVPALVISTDRRGLHDIVANTVVVNRR